MKTVYHLFTWPMSQHFIGNENAILVLPPETDTKGELDSAYLVPEDKVNQILQEAKENGLEIDGICPEGAYTKTEGEKNENEILDYYGNRYVPCD